MTNAASKLEALKNQFSALPPGAVELIDEALRKRGNLGKQFPSFGDYSAGLLALSERATLELSDEGVSYRLVLVAKTEGWDFCVSIDKTTGELLNPIQGEFMAEPLTETESSQPG